MSSSSGPNVFCIGGFVGDCWDVTVENCYNIGKVNVQDCSFPLGKGGSYFRDNIRGIAGFAGRLIKVQLGNLYNCGNVTIKNSTDIESVGGITGENIGMEVKDTVIKSSYNAGQIILENSQIPNVGGITGKNGEYGIIENCYYLKNDKINNKLEGVAQNDNEVTNSGSKEKEEELYNNDFLTNILKWNTDIWNISGTAHPTLK